VPIVCLNWAALSDGIGATWGKMMAEPDIDAASPYLSDGAPATR